MYMGAMLNCLEKGQKEDIQGDVNEMYESPINWIGGTQSRWRASFLYILTTAFTWGTSTLLRYHICLLSPVLCQRRNDPQSTSVYHQSSSRDLHE